MSTLDGAIQFVRDNKDRFLQEYKELLAIPSISTLSEHNGDVQRTAQWLADELTRHNIENVEIIPTPGHPVVYGESLHVPDKPTVLVYGHYDVQPVDPLDEWDSDPFGGEVRGDYIYARGASDMKGQLFTHLKALEALARQGTLPVNLKYMLESEEEIGSPNLAAFVEENKERLACDVVLNCDAGIHAPDTPAITYSLRGLAYFELKIQCAKKDLHSGLFGGSVLNPIHVLSEIIAGLHDENGQVTLPGFYDKVRPLDDEQRELMKAVPHSDDEWMEMAGTKALHGEAGYSTPERVGARPALDINGIWGGFTGEGAKTVLPARAYAKLSARLVADQDPAAIKDQLSTYLQAHIPKGVDWELHQHSSGPGSTMDHKSSYMQSAIAAHETVFNKTPIFKREGGSVPVVGLLQQALGVDSIMLGFALPDDGIHGPNERQYLPNIYRGMEVYIHFLLGL